MKTEKNISAKQVELLFEKFQAAYPVLCGASKACLPLGGLMFLVSLILALTAILRAERPLPLLVLNLAMLYSVGSSLIFSQPLLWRLMLKFQLRWRAPPDKAAFIRRYIIWSKILPMPLLASMVFLTALQIGFNTGAIPLPETPQ